MSLNHVTQDVVLIIISAVLYAKLLSKRREMKPFHVEVPPPQPGIIRFNRGLGWIPDRLRKWLLVKKNKPVERPKDVFDVLQQDPYTIEEIEQDKIWLIRYEQEDRFIFTDQLMQFLGITLLADDTIETILEQARHVENESWLNLIKEDIEKLKNATANPDPESIKMGTSVQNTTIVKLPSGDVLMYNPCHVHPQTSLSALLDKLGPVKWLVMGSSSHTLQLPSIIQHFPEALVVGATGAEVKLQAVSALPRRVLDYNIDIPHGERSLAELCVKLETQGVKTHYIHGDCATNALLLQYEGILMENDILYLHHKNCACCQCDLNNPINTNPAHWNRRFLGSLFHSKLMSHQQYNLPYYRFWMMDRSRLGNMMVESPAADGSSCTTMAASLRKMLSSDFTKALGVHQHAVISAADFKLSVNQSWRWLDGESLLDDQDS